MTCEDKFFWRPVFPGEKVKYFLSKATAIHVEGQVLDPFRWPQNLTSRAADSRLHSSVSQNFGLLYLSFANCFVFVLIDALIIC